MSIQDRLKKLKLLQFDPTYQDILKEDWNCLGEKHEEVWCSCCNRGYSNRQDVVIEHLRSNKHTAKRKLAQHEAPILARAKLVLLEYFRLNDRAPFQKLDIETNAYRVLTLRDWMEAGLHVSALKGNIKRRLEDAHYSLGGEGHIGQYVPIVQLSEILRMKVSVSDYVSNRKHACRTL